MMEDDADDDSTDGKYVESPSVDIPGALTGWWFEFDGRDPDWNDSKVNGYRDLIDFTPVFMENDTVPDVLTGVFHWPTFGWSWWPPVPTVHWEITAEANCSSAG